MSSAMGRNTDKGKTGKSSFEKDEILTWGMSLDHSFHP
jgi:hypothetical protein